MPALNPNGCRSTDSDYPITYRGHADPLAPAFFWVLPEDPFDTTCGYLDRDADGLQDWAEAELAWVFRPYLVFHWDEEEAGRADDPSLNGFQVFHQVHPILNSMDRMTTAGPLTRLVRIKAVVAFRRDSTHSGDTESVSYELISNRLDSNEPFTKWRLHAIYSQGCPNPSFCELNAFETGTWVIATTLNQSMTLIIDDEPQVFPTNMQVYLEDHGITETGRPCTTGLPPDSSNSASICLPKVFLSDDKHRPYLFSEICNACCHGSGRDACGADYYFGDGTSLPTCWGLPGVAHQTDNEISGFQTFSEYLAESSVQQNLYHSPKYIEMAGRYLGNVGEFHFNTHHQDGMIHAYLVDIHIIYPTFDDGISFFYSCLGTDGDVGTYFADWQHGLPYPVDENSIWSRVQRIPDPTYIHYASNPIRLPTQDICTPLDPGEINLAGFGTLSRQEANYDPIDSAYTGIAGLYANFPQTPSPGSNRSEFIWDFLGNLFCGSEYPCELALDGEGAEGFKYKFSEMTWPNQVERCAQEFFWDTDQDGAPDSFDCDPGNPYLGWDLDLDEQCDRPVPLEELAGCLLICSQLYDSSILTHDATEHERCIQRCQGSFDNCSPLLNSNGQPYGSQSESGQCKRLTLKYDSVLAYRCQQWFANADQADQNQNGTGDKCERGITEIRLDVRPDTFGMNHGFFSWCPDPTATVSTFLRRDRSMLGGGILSVGLCVCPPREGIPPSEADCRDGSTDPINLICPSDASIDIYENKDFSMKDFAWDSRTNDFRYFYHPLEAPSGRDLGVLTSDAGLLGRIAPGIRAQPQGLLARWRDVLFENVRIFLTFRTDRFRQFPGFHSVDMLETFPEDPIVSTHDRYSKLKFSSPQIMESRIPTDEEWNPQAPTIEYGLLHVPPGGFSYDPETDDVCVRFPRPVGQPAGYVEGSPLPVDPLWDPPRDLVDPLLGWIRDEDGAWRFFGVDPTSFQIRSYVAVPSAIDLRQTDVRVLRVDASLVGGASGTWATVAAVLDQGTVYLRDPSAPGNWTTIPTALPADQSVLAFHQAKPDSVWLVQRQSLFSAPVFYEVHLGSGEILRQQILPDWTFARVESMTTSRMGEAYFLLKRPAHLLPNLWKLDQEGLRSDLALPALVPPDRGALAMDGRSGKMYLVARAATDRMASMWMYDLVTKTWTRLSSTVPASVLREPRLALTAGRIVFSDLKDGRWWEWTQNRWVELGNPLIREVGP